MSLNLAPQLLLPIPPVLPQSDLLEPGWTQIRNLDEALRLLNRAADRDPREYPVGITLFARETGGRELSCWFESWAQLWMALRYVVIHLSGKRGEDLTLLARQLGQLRLSYGNDELQVARLQRMFGTQLRVLRLGTFQDLRAGVGRHAQTVVRAYLGCVLPEGAVAEVPSAELDRFVAFLRQRAFH
ncbi:MAG: hypothetical protein E6R07_04775 [Nevskiaceae bacterium]|nr:MAG: hypothetical protein E6R07_04775 [Nevskiaceae bacterium]